MEHLIKIPARKLVRLARDHKQAAHAVNLVYVNDRMPGITRVKKGKSFAYLFNGKTIRDKEVIRRIRALVIPPAWEKVWICPNENGHIQATGIDQKNRKQYLYHKKWSSLRNETKFYHLYEFGKSLPLLRKALKKDLAIRELNERRVLAIVISVMEQTYIRIGNKNYEKLYGSYGLTTLKDKNVEITKGKLKFTFVGKKGIAHDITLNNHKLANAVKQCRDIPGKELFQYYGADGERRKVESGMINNYIKEITGSEFTAKDFRTWAGTLQAFKALRACGRAESEADCKKNIIDALDQVSKKLGNSRSVCKKYYVHPILLTLYEKDELEKYCKQHTRKNQFQEPEECMLLKILKDLMDRKA